MKLSRYLISLICLVALFSCEERHPAAFDDICGVYFYNLSPTMAVVDSTDFTFVYESEDEVVFPVRIQMIGRAKDHDAEIDVTVTSDNAQEGVDYMLPARPVMPAGASYTDYELVLKRTDALKSEKKIVMLEIKANEHFDLPVTEIEQINGVVSTLRYKICFSDMFTSAPKSWDANLIGTFTQQKFELICDVMDIDPDDFNDPSKITLAKLLYISVEMTAYVKEQVEKKQNGEPYDKNAFDPVTGDPLKFTKG